MAKLVIEVPEELRGLGEAFATMVALDGNGKEKRTPHHFASAFSRRRDGDGGGREVTGWPMDAAIAVDAKTRPRAVSSSDSGRRGEWSIESVCREFTL